MFIIYFISHLIHSTLFLFLFLVCFIPIDLRTQPLVVTVSPGRDPKSAVSREMAVKELFWAKLREERRKLGLV